ncbi:hypothetical protein IE53DRAFT_92158 [Violaceomyces palustris]|uniref:Uncharacterized protein n=1 Tax=Violaceomyces palustris TaxID=1673888 RepID=A0ACD0NXF2_9BASI|nr:hypothetical protein IE53DRAFT_92158 [Violaceomyces palustris]
MQKARADKASRHLPPSPLPGGFLPRTRPISTYPVLNILSPLSVSLVALTQFISRKKPSHGPVKSTFAQPNTLCWPFLDVPRRILLLDPKAHCWITLASTLNISKSPNSNRYQLFASFLFYSWILALPSFFFRFFSPDLNSISLSRKSRAPLHFFSHFP